MSMDRAAVFTAARPTGGKEAGKRLFDILWKIAATAIVITLAFEDFDDIPDSSGGMKVPWPRFMMAFSLMAMLYAVTTLCTQRRLKIPRAWLRVFVFWLACLGSVAGLAIAGGDDQGFLQFVKTGLHLSVYVAFTLMMLSLANRSRFLFLTRAYYTLGLLSIPLALLQFAHGQYHLFPWMESFMFGSSQYEVVQLFRSSAFFGEPSYAARYYVHWMALSLAFYAQTKRSIFLFCFAGFILAFLVAGSLLGYAALFGFLVALAIVQLKSNVLRLSPRQRQTFGLVVATAVPCALILVLMVGSIQAPEMLEKMFTRVSLVTSTGETAGNRIDGFQAGTQVFLHNPLFGVGLGNMQYYIVEYYQDNSYFLRSRFNAEGMYPQIAGETGVIGLLAFLYLLFSMMRQRSQSAAVSEEHAEARAIFSLLRLDLIGQMLAMLNYSDLLNPHTWFYFSLILLAQQYANEAPDVAAVRIAVPDEQEARALPAA